MTPSTLLQGEAAQDHAPRLAEILSASFDTDGQRWSADSICQTLQSPGACALLASNGAALFRVIGDEAELLTIAVEPDQRGKGWGAALLQHTLDAAAQQGAASIFLEVAATNTKALALYARAGFTEIGQRAGYYRGADGNRTDAVILKRALT